jgi:uncharacterized protein with NAD-binding domain and iron-sulfur cluster
VTRSQQTHGPAREGRRRVAVLGGGAAGVTTAFELTATPELREQYEVTLYTPGWRLGGKGASGRNHSFGDRIEEHGLHIWFGFYDNAFEVMQAAYGELNRPRGTPLATWTDAFKPCDEVVLCERYEGRWILRDFHPPENPFTPGHPGFWDVVARIIDWLRGLWDRERGGQHGTHHLAEAHELARVGHRVERFAEHVLAKLLEGFRDFLWDEVLEARTEHDGLRFVFYCVDFLAAVARGVVDDDVGKQGFGATNDEEWMAWLGRHGASELTLKHAPFIRGYYDLAFAYEGGDKTRPNLAAGKATQDLIRIACTYKGAMLWKMQAGMGDTVFGPLYEVLAGRGVSLRFFHHATHLGIDPDRRRLERIEIQPQVELEHGADSYQPLYPVNGLPCWPSEPLWRQIRHGEELAALQLNLELEDPPQRLLPKRFELVRGEHFDDAVLAMSIGSLTDELCGELTRHSAAFADMLANSHTVATQAFQVWLTEQLRPGLGWPFRDDSILSSYVEPMDTYCNMSQLLDREAWPPADRVQDIAYFCGVLSDEPDETQRKATQRARHKGVTYLDRDAGTVWPKAISNGAFDWGYLFDQHRHDGEARFDAQYWRANIEGSERYVTTYAGTVKHRLEAHESGFENVWLAGDWTDNGIDGGSVEAAVASGRLASRAICGSPKEVPGTSGWLAGDGWR